MWDRERYACNLYAAIPVALVLVRHTGTLNVQTSNVFGFLFFPTDCEFTTDSRTDQFDLCLWSKCCSLRFRSDESLKWLTVGRERKCGVSMIRVKNLYINKERVRTFLRKNNTNLNKYWTIISIVFHFNIWKY